MTLVSLISYIDRNTLAILAPAMLEQLRLSNEEYGYVVSGFSLSYMASNIAWGRWLDRYGLPLAMTAAVAFWTLASVSHAFALGFVSLFAARFALGFGEGATFPGGLRTAVQTLPVEHRAKGTAVAYSGGSLGALITPVIINPVYQAWGWRGAFWFTGLIGLAWILLWQYVSRRPSMRLPSEIPAPAERPRFSDPLLWSFMLIYAFGSLPIGFILYYGALYLRSLGLSQVQIAGLLWLPPLGWEIGYFFWGWWTDRARGSFRNLFLLLTLLSLPLAAVPYLPGVTAPLALLSFSMFVAAGFLIGGVAYGASIFGPKHAGFIAGLSSGAWSGLVALVMPLVGRLFDQKLYATSFLLAACFPLAGMAVWLLVHRRRPAILGEQNV
jgi:ACS family hexuronate transporter-like MFS transporter